MANEDDFRDSPVPMRTDGKTSPLPRIEGPLKNVVPLSTVLQELRDEGIDIDPELEKRGLDKDGRPKK